MEEKGTAIVFPGQGSQRPGMGKDFHDNIQVSRDTYREASDALRWDVAAMCFGEDERLNLTEYTQPCILTTEIAMVRGLYALYGFSPALFGGHSLGEFTALVCAGVLPLAETLRIVQIRGRLMQEAVPLGLGGMSAVIAEDLDVDIIRRTLVELPLDVANVNSANQVVISGKLKAMPEAEARLRKTLGGDRPFRFVPLNVSAPFHSRFMKPIEGPFEEAFRTYGRGLNPEKAGKVTSNYKGGFHSAHHEEILRSMVSQLSNTVQWKENMKTLARQADTIYEVGPGRPLREFFRTINVTCSSVTTLSAAERLFEENRE
ncbi:MAG: ACP S-malonyltransferase [Syntrophales bacterium]|nr:ACP S-malonyltransferase [Syntrophales bacterium]